MAESKRSGLRRVAGLVGLAVVAIAIGIFAVYSPEQRETARDTLAHHAPPTPPAPTSPVPEPAAPAPVLRIAAHGRLTLEVDSLPDAGPLILVLDLPDEARGSGDRTVRVIAEDGRRIDTTASPLAGGGSGVRLEIDSEFLSSGRYLIEVDTEEKHPLQLRRFVLELN